MEHLHKLPSVLPGGCCFALVTSANFYLISVQLCRSDLNFEGRITGQWWIGCIKEGLNYPSPWWQHWPQGKVCVCVSVCVSWPTKSRQREKEGWSALALSTLLAPLQREEGERERKGGAPDLFSLASSAFCCKSVTFEVIWGESDPKTAAYFLFVLLPSFNVLIQIVALEGTKFLSVSTE